MLPRPGIARQMTAGFRRFLRSGFYEGSFRTWPGLILSGSLRTSRFASKILVYLLASPRCCLAIPLSVSPAWTV